MAKSKYLFIFIISGLCGLVIHSSLLSELDVESVKKNSQDLSVCSLCGQEEVQDGILWQYSKGGRLPDVFIHWCPSAPKDWMYLPAPLSLGAAFAHFGGQIVFTQPKHEGQMTKYIQQSLAYGRRPVLVLLAFWANSVVNGTKEFLKNMADSGAFIVMYQTETFASGDADLKWALMNSPQVPYRVDEVWDYSYANIKFLKQRGRDSHNWTFRYFPPGYIAEFDSCDPLNATVDTESVGFLGRWSYRNKKSKAYEDLLGARIVTEQKVFGRGPLCEFVGKYPIQLNVHRGEECCPSPNPIEAFRLSQLLSTRRACVLSSQSFSEDQREWEGMVHFLGNNSAEQLQALRQNIEKCQKETYNTFRKKFHPARLLKESGFVDKWVRTLRTSGNHASWDAWWGLGKVE
eukprot:Skav213601  [mRNA]  locus=scaffold1971:56282:57490:+ [translate_table: standard]